MGKRWQLIRGTVNAREISFLSQRSILHCLLMGMMKSSDFNTVYLSTLNQCKVGSLPGLTPKPPSNVAQEMWTTRELPKGECEEGSLQRLLKLMINLLN